MYVDMIQKQEGYTLYRNTVDEGFVQSNGRGNCAVEYENGGDEKPDPGRGASVGDWVVAEREEERRGGKIVAGAWGGKMKNKQRRERVV